MIFCRDGDARLEHDPDRAKAVFRQGKGLLDRGAVNPPAPEFEVELDGGEHGRMDLALGPAGPYGEPLDLLAHPFQEPDDDLAAAADETRQEELEGSKAGHRFALGRKIDIHGLPGPGRRAFKPHPAPENGFCPDF
jgi:hypothetical protein